MHLGERLLLKKGPKVWLPAIAGSIVLIFTYSRITTDTLEKAGKRFGNAIKRGDTRQILSFLESDEKIALEIDEAKLKRLLDFTIANNYPGLNNFDLVTRKEDGILEVALQDLNSKDGEKLSFAFVGEPGNFRSPGFVWSLLLIAGKKEFPRPEIKGGIGKALSMSDYMVANEKKLIEIGIPALFNSDQKALVPFQTRANLIYSKYEELKSKKSIR